MKLALACVTPDGYSINGINMQRSVYIDLCSQISNLIEKIGSAPIVLPETASKYEAESRFDTLYSDLIGGIIGVDPDNGTVDINFYGKTLQLFDAMEKIPYKDMKVGFQIIGKVENSNIKCPRFLRAVCLLSEEKESDLVLYDDSENPVFDSDKIHFIDHPLVQHKISILRDKNTGTNEFRTLTSEVAMLEGFVALSDLPTELVDVETPIAKMKTPMISGKKLAIVPILRAGLGMVDGILSLVPTAKVGHIGLYRDPNTHEPHDYYCKLPDQIDKRTVVVLDPMLATGGSACDAITSIKSKGCTDIKFVCIIAAPEGLLRLHDVHPDIQIYVGHLDERLNENAYIVGGLGDAGDRIFGTK